MKTGLTLLLLILSMTYGNAQEFPPPQNPTGHVIGWNIVHLYWDPPARELSSYNVYVNGGILFNTTETEYFDTVFYAYVRYYHITAVYINPDGESDTGAYGIWIGIPELQMFPYFQDFEEQRVILATSAIIGNDFWNKTTEDPFAGNQAACFFSQTYGNVSRIYSPPFYDYTSKGNVEVGFWYKNKTVRNNHDDLYFLYTSASGWETIGPLPESDNWAHYDTIVPYMGGMHFGFDAVCKNGDGIMLDNIELTLSPVGMEDYVADKEILEQNYPNPCTSETYISINIEKEGNYNLSLYDLSGKKVKSILDKYLTSGRYNVFINLGDLEASTYFYELKGMDTKQTRLMVVR